jgi:hypothetical protein
MPEPNATPADGDKSIAAFFVTRGYLYFYPERRGHGNSRSAGPYIMNWVRAERTRNGKDAGDAR